MMALLYCTSPKSRVNTHNTYYNTIANKTIGNELQAVAFNNNKDNRT